MGLFQLRLLSRIPDYAAVDTAVSLTRESAGRAAAGFVNAVLRRAIRTPVALPARSDDETGFLAITYSHPRWLVERLVEWFGTSGAESLMAANNQPAPNVIRLNLRRGEPQDLAASLTRDGMRVARWGQFPETAVLAGAPVLMGESWKSGLFQPQAEASQIVSRLLAPRPGAVVLDCAAAPGGKAAHLAELVGPEGRVLAIDLNFRGLLKARSTVSRLGHGNVLLVCADASNALPLRQHSAELVLLDAPCTGLGTLREHPEIRWRLQESDIERMAKLQKKMLRKVAEAVAPGGALVYAVCSIAPPEGSDQIRAFLADNPDFAIDQTPLGDRHLAKLLDADGCLRSRPDRDGLDGFFAVRLKRKP